MNLPNTTDMIKLMKYYKRRQNRLGLMNTPRRRNHDLRAELRRTR